MLRYSWCEASCPVSGPCFLKLVTVPTTIENGQA
uniref:Uncharacterized protein n=1 Tax=Myoviridae sp. ctu2j3 TaxID=2825197 RepID=A0A8S5UI44_9CAUD|nr:MAG TPA: hypothetical protein [Myoviridae sp. ctu2j3]DAF94311.1 MAG TPA: hypothetical protein [Myoviridae sp. ctu2j3]